MRNAEAANSTTQGNNGKEVVDTHEDIGSAAANPDDNHMGNAVKNSDGFEFNHDQNAVSSYNDSFAGYGRDLDDEEEDSTETEPDDTQTQHPRLKTARRFISPPQAQEDGSETEPDDTQTQHPRLKTAHRFISPPQAQEDGSETEPDYTQTQCFNHTYIPRPPLSLPAASAAQKSVLSPVPAQKKLLPILTKADNPKKRTGPSKIPREASSKGPTLSSNTVPSQSQRPISSKQVPKAVSAYINC